LKKTSQMSTACREKKPENGRKTDYGKSPQKWVERGTVCNSQTENNEKKGAVPTPRGKGRGTILGQTEPDAKVTRENKFKEEDSLACRGPCCELREKQPSAKGVSSGAPRGTGGPNAARKKRGSPYRRKKKNPNNHAGGIFRCMVKKTKKGKERSQKRRPALPKDNICPSARLIRGGWSQGCPRNDTLN